MDIGGEVLCGRFQDFLTLTKGIFVSSYHLITISEVSQFTLLASTKKGNKPDFHGAMGGDDAKRLYQYFFEKVQQGYMAERVKNGVFQAMMEVALVNDGPVCLGLHSIQLNKILTILFSQVTLEISAGQKPTPAPTPTPTPTPAPARGRATIDQPK